MVRIKFQGHQLTGSRVKIFQMFLSCLGMVAIRVM